MLKRRRIVRECSGLLIALPLALGVLSVMHWTGLFNGALHPYRRWIAAGLLVVAASPYLAWSLLRPPVLDATAYGKTLHYEFRDRGTAALFAVYNGTKFHS